MLKDVMQQTNLGEGGIARLLRSTPTFETETSVATLMARSAPSTVSTVLWNASDSAGRQALLDAAQASASSEQSEALVSLPSTNKMPATSLATSSDQFLSMLDTVTYPADQVEELMVGNDQGSGKGGVSVGDIDAINDSLMGQSFSAPDSRVTSALSKAGISFQTNANGSIYVPSAGGYAVHASTGLGVSIGQALADNAGSRTQASSATATSSGSTSTVTPAPATATANEIVVTAQSRSSTSSSGASFSVNPFAATSVSSPQAQPTRATSTPVEASEIIVTATRNKDPEPFAVATRTTISRAQLDSWWVEFSHQTSTLGPRSDDVAIRQSFADAYARVTEGELAAKAVAIDVVTTAIIAPAGAALVAVAAPVIAGAAFAQGTVLYYTTAEAVGGTGNMLLNDGTHRLTNDAPVTAGERLGSFASGMIFGGQFVIKGLSPVANGAAFGFVGSGTGKTIEQYYDTRSINVSDIGTSALIGTIGGAAGGAIGDTAILGVTSGRGNWAANYQGVSTRIANGNAFNMSPGVAFRGGVANQANQIWSNATAAGSNVLIAPRVDQSAHRP